MEKVTSKESGTNGGPKSVTQRRKEPKGTISYFPVVSRSGGPERKTPFTAAETVSARKIVTTSSCLSIRSSAQWPVTRLTKLIFLFFPRKKYFILKYIFSLCCVYLGLWNPYECRGKQYFGTDPSRDSPGLHVHAVEPPGFSHTLHSPFRRWSAGRRLLNPFFSFCSTGGHVWPFLWPSFLLLQSLEAKGSIPVNSVLCSCFHLPVPFWLFY